MFSSFFQIENEQCSWQSARLPLCALKTITTAISFKSFFCFPPIQTSRAKKNHAFPCIMIFFFLFASLWWIEKRLHQAGQISCSLVTVPDQFKIKHISMHSQLHSKYLILKRAVPYISFCNLLPEYSFSHLIFCTLRNQCSKFNYTTFLQLKWFSLSHIPSVCRKRNMSQSKLEKLGNKQQPDRCSSYR